MMDMVVKAIVTIVGFFWVPTRRQANPNTRLLP